MDLDLRFVKRIFSTASGFSALLSVCYMNQTGSNANIDIIVIMFLWSNLLTIAGLRLKDSFNQKIGKIFIYAFSLSIIVLIFDCAFKYSMSIPLVCYKIICVLLIIVMTIYFLIVYSYSLTNKEIEKQIKESVAEVSKTFEQTVNDLSNKVDEMGGWQEFLKTDVGRQMAKEVKKYSSSKTPRDFRKHRKKGKR